jgi:predicted metal-binding protein
MTRENVVEAIRRKARELGASSTQLISTKDIYAEHWVRQKCQYGCSRYAKRFTCPPYSPTPEETSKILPEYRQALLVHFADVRDEKRPVVHEIMFNLEREAFLNGLYKAFAYAAGPCRLCANCVAEEIQGPNEYSKKECKFPEKARPSLEAAGVNVFRTASKAGYPIRVIRQKGDCFTLFGLLLLD